MSFSFPISEAPTTPPLPKTTTSWNGVSSLLSWRRTSFDSMIECFAALPSLVLVPSYAPIGVPNSSPSAVPIADPITLPSGVSS